MAFSSSGAEPAAPALTSNDEPIRRSSRPPGTTGHSRPPARDAMRPSQRAMQSIVEQKDLSVVFQPIVDLETGRQFATEALVRCCIAELKDPVVLFRHAVANKCSGRLGRMIREIALPHCAGS